MLKYRVIIMLKFISLYGFRGGLILLCLAALSAGLYGAGAGVLSADKIMHEEKAGPLPGDSKKEPEKKEPKKNEPEVNNKEPEKTETEVKKVEKVEKKPMPAAVRLRRMELGNCDLIAAPGLQRKAEAIKKRLEEGLGRLYTIFEKPALKAAPVYWLLKEEKELETVLADKRFNLKPAQKALALQRGLFRNDRHIVVKLDPIISDDWLLRILFTEYSRNLMDALAPSAKNLRIGWFYAGLSTYMSWMVVAEQDNQNRKIYERYILQYYGRFYTEKGFLPLELLENPADWEAALGRNPQVVFSQAVLAYQYLARLKGPTIGVVILRIFEREDAFNTAFERATLLKLPDFEKKMSEEFYPQLKALQGRL